MNANPIFVSTIKKNNMTKNIRTIEINIETDIFLNLIKKTPALKNLFNDSQLKNLKVGKNIINVNNFIYSKLDNFGFFNVNKIK
jgi:hypothetical protein